MKTETKKNAYILTPPLIIMVVLYHKVHGTQWKYWSHRLYMRQRMGRIKRNVEF